MNFLNSLRLCAKIYRFHHSNWYGDFYRCKSFTFIFIESFACLKFTNMLLLLNNPAIFGHMNGLHWISEAFHNKHRPISMDCNNYLLDVDCFASVLLKVIALLTLLSEITPGMDTIICIYYTLFERYEKLTYFPSYQLVSLSNPSRLH